MFVVETRGVYCHHVCRQLSPEWFACHSRRLTASIAAGAIGMSPFTSPQKAWRVVMGKEPPVSAWQLEHGKEFEHVAAARYEIDTGTVLRPTGFHSRLDIPWLGASPDRLVGDHGLLECKVSGVDFRALPHYYRVQALVQLIVTGRQWCDVCIYKNGTIKVWRVYPSGCAGLLKRLGRWYSAHIVGDRVPKRGEYSRCPQINQAKQELSARSVSSPLTVAVP